jgi:glyoxylase-like metal-dependent hydrolase (beta-lactamase superfamily II)
MLKELPMIPTIDVPTLRQWLALDQPVTVLDVRQTADHADWAIPGSVHVNAYHALKAHDPEALAGLDLPAGVPVVTVCGAGKVSLIAAEQLIARGHTVYSLDGGMQAWSLAWNTARLPRLADDTQVIQIRRTGKGCLSYMIGSAGQAVVLDASLDPQVYQDLATMHGWTITTVLDTHVHADHLSRARVLAEATGATLHMPATDRLAYPGTPIHDGMTITVGNAALRALHTPGHTWESTSYLLADHLLFTGDTLFLAAVGRPDLEAQTAEAQERAAALYQSLQRLMALPETTQVLPGHTSTPAPFDSQPIMAALATVRAAIPRLQLSESAFIATLLAALPPTPPNHQQIVTMNQQGAAIPADVTPLEAGANRCAIA